MYSYGLVFSSFSQIWPGVSKHFAVLHSRDHQKSYRPQYKTIIDLDTFDQVFGNPDQADRVSKMLTHKLEQLASRWNELYSSDHPEVIKYHVHANFKSTIKHVQRVLLWTFRTNVPGSNPRVYQISLSKKKM